MPPRKRSSYPARSTASFSASAPLTGAYRWYAALVQRRGPKPRRSLPVWYSMRRRPDAASRSGGCRFGQVMAGGHLGHSEADFIREAVALSAYAHRRGVAFEIEAGRTADGGSGNAGARLANRPAPCGAPGSRDGRGHSGRERGECFMY